MGKIIYNITGSFPPFGVELRQNNITGTVLRKEVKETIGQYEFDNLITGTYVIAIYDNAGGITSTNPITINEPIIPPPPPENPDLYVAVRGSNTSIFTNTNSVFESPSGPLQSSLSNIYVYITTDKLNTQFPPLLGEAFVEPLYTPVNIQLNISGNNTEHRVTSVAGSTGTPLNVTISSAWSSQINQNSITLPAGFTSGYIQIGARTNSVAPEDFLITIASPQSPFGDEATTGTFGNGTDLNYVTRINPINESPTLYGYDTINNSGIVIRKGVEQVQASI